MAGSGSTSQGNWPAVVFGATFLLVAALVVKLFLAEDVSASLVAAIAVLVGLLIVSPRVFELVELTTSKEGLVAKLREIEQDVKKADKRIDQLFAYTMSDLMFDNLRKLAGGEFGHFENAEGLRRELRHLRDVGYISINRHIGDLPDEGENLSDYVTVTPVGREFVALRESLQSDAS